MKWNIIYSENARDDLHEIYEYIVYELLSPDAARNQTERIMKSIRSLDEMPMRFPLYSQEPWHSMGLRFFPANNYLVFYLTDEAKHSVSIARIMYGGRDIKNKLLF